MPSVRVPVTTTSCSPSLAPAAAAGAGAGAGAGAVASASCACASREPEDAAIANATDAATVMPWRAVDRTLMLATLPVSNYSFTSAAELHHFAAGESFAV